MKTHSKSLESPPSVRSVRTSHLSNRPHPEKALSVRAKITKSLESPSVRTVMRTHLSNRPQTEKTLSVPAKMRVRGLIRLRACLIAWMPAALGLVHTIFTRANIPIFIGTRNWNSVSRTGTGCRHVTCGTFRAWLYLRELAPSGSLVLFSSFRGSSCINSRPIRSVLAPFLDITNLPHNRRGLGGARPPGPGGPHVHADAPTPARDLIRSARPSTRPFPLRISSSAPSAAHSAFVVLLSRLAVRPLLRSLRRPRPCALGALALRPAPRSPTPPRVLGSA